MGKQPMDFMSYFDASDCDLAEKVYISHFSLFSRIYALTLVRNLGYVGAANYIHSFQNDCALEAHQSLRAAIAKFREIDKCAISVELIQDELDYLRDNNIAVYGISDYPPNLSRIDNDLPPVIYVKGNPSTFLNPSSDSIAIVGSRNATHYGTTITTNIASELSADGVCVCSGGAFGIDLAAHAGAISHQNIAFLACGIDLVYPIGNQGLFEKMLTNGGTIATEYPIGTTPKGYFFLERNRLIAGFSNATIVTEASWRSGAMSTAAHARKYLRPVGAVPGQINSAASAGCHKLIRELGAILIGNSSNALELIRTKLVDTEGDFNANGNSSSNKINKQRQEIDKLPSLQREILNELLKQGGRSITELSTRLCETVTELGNAVVELELLGYIKFNKDSSKYTRVNKR